MKGLILSGGKGTRLQPLTYTTAKQLIPLSNKPVLVRVIETIKEAGITDLGIVIGDTGNEVRSAIGNGDRWGVKVTYIEQDQPLGLAHAVKISADFLGKDRFVMFLGDNVIQGGISKLIAQFSKSDYNSQVVLTHVEDPRQFGVAELDNEGQIKQLIEKPEHPPSNLALVGIYMFDHHIMEAVNAITPSWRGELEITHAIQWLIDQGHNVHPYVHHGWWIDTGKPKDMIEANSYVLEELKPTVDGYIDRDSEVDARVTIEQGAEIINSVIRGPAIIGKNSRIVNAYIGPFTSIYHDCLVENAEIARSILLENCQVRNINGRIEDSLIGRNVVIHRSPIRPKSYKFTLGDNSVLGLLNE
ncbi:MAG: glucose-1-phosphate thymidylyltransferase [Chloroflexota bacterium]